MYGGASSRPMAWSGGGSTQVSKLRIEVSSFDQEYDRLIQWEYLILTFYKYVSRQLPAITWMGMV